MAIEVDHIVRGGEPEVRTRGMVASRSVNVVRHPRGSYRVILFAGSEVATGHTRKQSSSLALPSIGKKVGTRCRSPSYERFLEGCNSPLLRLADHLTAFRAWCKQCLPGLVKTRRAPSRHSKDARVYGHSTDYGHAQIEYTPPRIPRRRRNRTRRG